MTDACRLARAYPPEAILTPDQVAEWLQVSRRTVQRLPLPAVTMGHRTVRYLAKEILEYLERQSE